MKKLLVLALALILALGCVSALAEEELPESLDIRVLVWKYDDTYGSTVRAAMEKCGLDPDSRKWVSKYSLGMRQRLGIAQAIMEDPSLLILDEPMNGLDKHGVEEIRELLRELNRDGTTIILSSHYAEDIEALCDTVCEMDAGVLTVLE